MRRSVQLEAKFAHLPLLNTKSTHNASRLSAIHSDLGSCDGCHARGKVIRRLQRKNVALRKGKRVATGGARATQQKLVVNKASKETLKRSTAVSMKPWLKKSVMEDQRAEMDEMILRCKVMSVAKLLVRRPLLLLTRKKLCCETRLKFFVKPLLVL